MEGEFGSSLQKLTPTPDLMYIMRNMVKGANREILQQGIKNNEYQIEQLFDRIVKSGKRNSDQCL